MTSAEYIPEIVNRIVEGFHPLRIILFGSQARGEATADSDVDLLVVLAEVENKRESAVAIQGAILDIPVAKDVIVTTPDEIQRRGHLVSSILRPALREGRELYARP